MKRLPHRPISGGTNNGVRLKRYNYWRTGYNLEVLPGLDFWVTQAGEFHSKPNYIAGHFEHTEETQFIYHLEGEATFEHKQERKNVSIGDIMIIPPYFPFSYVSLKGAKHHWFALDGKWPGIFGDVAVSHLSLNYDSKIDDALVAMREILILRKPGYQLRVLGRFYQMMAQIEQISGKSSNPESVYPESVRNAIIYLRENYADSFNGVKTAAAAGLSQSHLRALFEKWVGESPKRFHTRYRIEQAKRLLHEQSLPVFEVAFHVGYFDKHHFSRVFKQITGVPPSHYATQSNGTLKSTD